MYLKTLECKNYRSYPRLSLEFSPQGNVFCGANAQGKTNILEAVYLCSCARSHRTGRDNELIHQGEASYEVKINFVSDNGSEESIEIQYLDESLLPSQRFPGAGKKVRKIYHNGLELGRIADLFGLFHCVIFAPEDLMLVKEGPAGRRRFIDILISRLSPSYFKDLQLYQRILQQRNKVLKRFRDSGQAFKHDAISKQMRQVEMEVWNMQMAQCGARLIHRRQHFLERLKIHTAEAMDSLSNSKENYGQIYRCCSGVNAEDSLEEIEKAYFQRLEATSEDDMQRGSSSQGPHRDDLELSLNDLPIKQYASQGQQRSVVLALKLAELNVIEEECGERPVLLLDDVMSELDRHRRKYLMQSIDEHQVIITCTDQNQVSSEGIVSPKLFLVHQSQVTVAERNEQE